MMSFLLWVFSVSIYYFVEVGFSSNLNVPPPLPLLPLPNANQLKWQQREMIMFTHFGINTFTNNEKGNGKEDPYLFNPNGLDANQWVKVAKEAGFSLVILTTKHHDGFCLWPSQYTNHSVKSSPWKDGEGDVVKDVSMAAKAQGLDFGVYLSPWDRYEPFYGNELQYNEFYLGQLHELLTRYGTISEVWIDRFKGDNTTMIYHFSEWFSIVKELQINANVFIDAGVDIRWVGNENGVAGLTSWSTINGSSSNFGQVVREYLSSGDPYGTDWMPPECDVSIRKGWFWHSDEEPKSLSQLLDIYYTSVGRNCVLLLNVPPNTTGLFSKEDVERLMDFKRAINTIFSNDLAASSHVTASSVRGEAFSPSNVLNNDIWTYWAPKHLGSNNQSHWIELKADEAIEFNVVRIQETKVLGQRVMEYGVYVSDGDAENKMMLVGNGTTVGYKKLHRLEKPVKAMRVSLVIWKFKGDVPIISSFGLHFDPFYNGVSP